jgi:hypothetical protein
LTEASLKVIYGNITIKTIQIPMKGVKKVTLNNKEVDIKITDELIVFNEPVTIEEGSALSIQ